MSQGHRIIRLSDGSIVFDVVGADSGNENEEDVDEDLDDDADDADDDEDEDESEDEPKTAKQLKADLAAANAAAARADRRMRRADRAKSKALNELTSLKTGGAKELADAQKKVQELEAALAAATGTDTTSAIREEFRDSDKYAWHNRKLAFSLLDISDVDVDENGNVDAESLTDALDKLAKDHPYLIKTAKAAEPDDDDDDDEPKAPARPKSGGSFNGRKQPKSTTDTARLAQKFPVLGGRF